MSCIKIIGTGSAQGRDQVGWHLIERLQQSGFEQRYAPGRVLLENCRFPAQLIQMLRGCDRAIIVDAVEREAGEVFEYSREALALSPHLHSTHGIGVGEALALAERLLPVPVEVRILGLGVGRAGDRGVAGLDTLETGLLERLEQALQSVIGRESAVDNFSSSAR